MTQKRTILIVDDDPLNVKLLAGKLASDAYEPLVAYDGKSALALTREKAPDLILLDVMMPEINGYQVTETLKQDPETKDIPIILITALDGAEDKLKGLEAGADEFLNKPVNTAELLARVKSLLRLKLYQDQLKVRASCEACVVSGGEAVDPHQALNVNLPTILLVEDNEKDIRLIQNYLYGETYRIEVARTGEETLSRVLKEKIDLVLLDILLPGMDGFEVVRRLKEIEEAEGIQIVAITSLQDMESKVLGIELGADEYLIKPINKHELKVRIKSLVKKKIYLDGLRNGYETAIQSAITDKLTGCYNRAYFEHFIRLEIKRAQRQKSALALVMMDIDDFKFYNDTFGHLTGDRILRKLGRLVLENIREIDLAARYGGEEFAFVLPHTNAAGARVVAERLRGLIADHAFYPDRVPAPQPLTVSLGVAVYSVHGTSVEELIQAADDQLYRAKREGKNRVCVDSSDTQRKLHALS